MARDLLPRTGAVGISRNTGRSRGRRRSATGDRSCQCGEGARCRSRRPDRRVEFGAVTRVAGTIGVHPPIRAHRGRRDTPSAGLPHSRHPGSRRSSGDQRYRLRLRNRHRLSRRWPGSRLPRPIVPDERKHLTDKPNDSKQLLSTARTRRSGKHARPTATAPDIDATDSPRSLPASPKQPVRTAQELPPSNTDPATLERTATVLAEHVRALVDSFPPLTPDQRDRIAALLRTPVTGRHPA